MLVANALQPVGFCSNRVGSGLLADDCGIGVKARSSSSVVRTRGPPNASPTRRAPRYRRGAGGATRRGRVAPLEPQASARLMSGVDDRCWLVSNKLPGAMLAHPNRKIAIVDLYDRAGYRNPGRHPSGHERGAVDN
jgi:hypothetical protein